MKSPTIDNRRFGQFKFDGARNALYVNGELVRVEKKSLEVLDVLLHHPRSVVTSAEIIEAVWKDNLAGVTSIHLAQNISKLRKVFNQYDPGVEYIQNVKGVGYIFVKEVETNETVSVSESNEQNANRDDSHRTRPAQIPRRPWNRIFALAGLSTLIMFAVLAWFWFSVDDEKEIRKVVEDSQKYESLVLYRDPSNIDESKISEYWLPEEEFGDEVDIKRIRAGVDRLLRENKRYGPETKCEQFEFQFVEINNERNFATVKTLEKWFISEYLNDGRLFKNKTVGPYFVYYIVRKINGRWLIEKSNTARATPPQPELTGLEPVTGAAAGKQFFVRLTGKNFISDSVRLTLIGPGCPETNPCSVPNSALRMHSEITDTSITYAPLSLSSGEFTVFAQNGDSLPSNAMNLSVR